MRALRRARSLPPVPPVLQGWDQPALCHGFLGREGGSSRGPYASLNLSYWVGDQLRSVDANWQRARRLMPLGVRFAQLKQVHGKAIHAVGPRADAYPRPEGDGLVTAMTGIVLCIFTADCVPVLLADTQTGVVGALHAGWRGTLAGIAGAGVRAMVRQGARTSAIRALLGPSIGPLLLRSRRRPGQALRAPLRARPYACPSKRSRRQSLPRSPRNHRRSACDSGSGARGNPENRPMHQVRVRALFFAARRRRLDHRPAAQLHRQVRGLNFRRLCACVQAA